MALKIVCSGYMVRFPVGGLSWHHLQYLVGLQRMGHEVVFCEDYGWPDSCYDPVQDAWTADPEYGIGYLQEILRPFGLQDRWCYLGEDGSAYGMTRAHLADYCRECDVYFNLSNMNWISETSECRVRALVDTDPVFTQIGAHGLGGPFSQYHRLFTYGENVHRPGCEMPTGGSHWLATRQPVVLDLWSVEPGERSRPFTTVVHWSAYGEHQVNGKMYGQKDREFPPFYDLPRETGEIMEIAADPPEEVRARLQEGGWRITNPLEVTRTPLTYQQYIRNSRAEFCVAKHGYVSTRCGWFSDRSAAYLASGRPVVLQDTGFSRFLPCGEGLQAYRTPDEAKRSVRRVGLDYEKHCQSARAIAAECFDSERVLSDLLEQSLS